MNAPPLFMHNAITPVLLSIDSSALPRRAMQSLSCAKRHEAGPGSRGSVANR
jgi:hypothetical protein